MTDVETEAPPHIESAEAETERIIRSGTIWLAAVIITAALMLGPSVAAGWRPADLPAGEQVLWWFGALAAAGGIAALVWAGCPTLGYPVQEAWRQKRRSIRFGIVASLAGMAVAGLAVLAVPAA